MHLVTYQALERLMKEWTITKMLALAVEDGDTEAPFIKGGSCLLQCSLPLQYGLSCKCWMYACAVTDMAIPLSLIHPQWLLNGPEYVYSEMTFDPGFTEDKYADAYANNDDNRPDLGDEDDVDGEHEIRGDRYRDRGASLVESAVLRVVDQQKRIESTDLSEEYARQLENVLNRFERRWKEKEQVNMSLPTTSYVS